MKNLKKISKIRLINKQYSKLLAYFILLITLIPINPINKKTALGLDDSSIIVDPSTLNVAVVSGDVIESGFTVRNLSEEDLEYEISYSSNLEWDENTVGLWNFNEGQGDEVSDSSPYNNHGQVYGATWVNGKFGKALHFDGLDDYVIVQSTPSLNIESITMEAWVRPNSTVDTMPLGAVKFWEYGLLYYETGYFRPHVWANGLKWYDTYTELVLDEWHYVALTYDSNTGILSWYLDGVKVDSRYEGLGKIQASEYPLIFGRAWTEQMWYFYNGGIDEIRISDIARDEEEIQSNYIRGTTGMGEWAFTPKGIKKISPGSSDEIMIQIYADILSPGTYSREITIQSTSIYGPIKVVPIELDVSSANHDLVLRNLIMPDKINAKERVRLEINVRNQGTFDESNVKLGLEINGREMDYKMINSISANENDVTNFWWIPAKAGYYMVRVSIDALPNESNLNNNFISRIILVEGEPIINIDKKSIEIICNSTQDEIYEFHIDNMGTDSLDYFLYDEYSDVIFYDDMENGQGSWAHSGQFDSWQLGQPLQGPESTISGYNCWATGLNINYEDASDAVLITPSINLKGRIAPELSFWTWYDIDPNGDHGYVEVKDGDSWVRINGDGFLGYSQDWQRVAYDLSDFIGKEVVIRFRLVSDEYLTGKGWYIDDVKIFDLAEPVNDYMIQSPTGGKIDAEDSKKITVTIKTPYLLHKETYDNIYINSNDQNYPLIIMPIKIILFGNINSNQSETMPLKVVIDDEIIINEDEPHIFRIHNITGGTKPYNYTWKIYDSETLIFNEEQPTHIFKDPGIYNATIIVVDKDSSIMTESQTVIVLDITPPTAIAGPDVNTSINLLNVFNASKSYDNKAVHSYIWDFGDGTNTNGMVVIHTYSNEGNYTVTLTIKDEAGNEGTDKINVIVKSIMVIELDNQKELSSFERLLFYLMVILAITTVILILFTLKRLYDKKEK